MTEDEMRALVPGARLALDSKPYEALWEVLGVFTDVVVSKALTGAEAGHEYVMRMRDSERFCVTREQPIATDGVVFLVQRERSDWEHSDGGVFRGGLELTTFNLDDSRDVAELEAHKAKGARYVQVWIREL